MKNKIIAFFFILFLTFLSSVTGVFVVKYNTPVKEVPISVKETYNLVTPEIPDIDTVLTDMKDLYGEFECFTIPKRCKQAKCNLDYFTESMRDEYNLHPERSDHIIHTFGYIGDADFLSYSKNEVVDINNQQIVVSVLSYKDKEYRYWEIGRLSFLQEVTNE